MISEKYTFIWKFIGIHRNCYVLYPLNLRVLYYNRNRKKENAFNYPQKIILT